MRIKPSTDYVDFQDLAVGTVFGIGPHVYLKVAPINRVCNAVALKGNEAVFLHDYADCVIHPNATLYLNPEEEPS